MGKKLTAVLAACLAVLLLLGELAVPSAAQSVARFGTVSALKLIVSNGATVDDLTTTDDATVGDDATISGDLTLGQQTAATITQAGTLTPAGSYQQITAAGAVSFGSITAGTAGDLLTLINVGSNTITISDTGTLKLAGNAALGQYDTIVLLSDGTNWVQLSKADN